MDSFARREELLKASFNSNFAAKPSYFGNTAWYFVDWLSIHGIRDSVRKGGLVSRVTRAPKNSFC
jgi:hypothetical protein